MKPNTPEFRSMFVLDPEVAFLNHGSFGACPRPVIERWHAWQMELERQPVAFMSLGRGFEPLLRDARASLARYVHVDPHDLIFHTNSTSAINQVARSLVLQPGDEVLGNDHEYGAIEKTWRFVNAKSGASYVRATIPVPLTTREGFVEHLWSHVTPHTKVILLSHVTSATALTLPVKEVCARARAAGILTVIDGAHAPAYVDLDLRDIDPDFYAGNCHKWLCAPKGSAFLYARRELQHLLEPLVVSWGWETDRPSGSRFVDENEYPGTFDPSARLAVAEAIAFQRDHDWTQVRASCRDLAARTRDRIVDLTGLPPLAGSEWQGQMCTLPLPECDVDVVKQRLYDEHRVEVPVYRWNDRPYLRFSIQGYNTETDVERLLRALQAILQRVE